MKIAVVEIYSHHLFVKTISDCLIARGPLRHSVCRADFMIWYLHCMKIKTMPEVIVGGEMKVTSFFLSERFGTDYL